MYVLKHKTNQLFYNSNQPEAQVPFGGPEETADRFADKDSAEAEVQKGEQFFHGLFPQNMDIMNRHDFLRNCEAVEVEA